LIDDEHGRTRLVQAQVKKEQKKYQIAVDRKALRKLKAQIKVTTRKPIPASFDERIARLNLLQKGWINYFPDASGPTCTANVEILMSGFAVVCVASSGPDCIERRNRTER
jgi:hypothetical protein